MSHLRIVRPGEQEPSHEQEVEKALAAFVEECKRVNPNAIYMIAVIPIKKGRDRVISHSAGMSYLEKIGLLADQINDEYLRGNTPEE